MAARSPDVAMAVDTLAESGVLPAPAALVLGRVARGELVSLHALLRLLLYAGVLVTMAGVGILVTLNLDRIGPLAIAIALLVAAAACFGWVARRAPAFTWGEQLDPHLGLDYVLLLGVLLAAADLAYVEVKFTALGALWTWHLLIVAVVAGALAVRYDSRVVFGVALTSFAAWRGVAVSFRGAVSVLDGASSPLRANAIGCGLLFVAMAHAMEARDRKAHFAGVPRHMGWLLLLGALLSGVDASSGDGLAWSLALLIVGGALAAYSYRTRRFALFAFGMMGAYCGVTALAFRIPDFGDLAFYWFFLSAILILVALLVAHHGMKEPA
jgi:hypothetical protein